MHISQNILGVVGLLIVMFLIGFGFFYLISKGESDSKRFYTSKAIRLMLSLLSILFAWIFPWTALKVLFVLSCILFLLSIFPIKKTSFIVITLVIIISLSIITSISLKVSHYFEDKNSNFYRLPESISRIIFDMIDSGDFTKAYNSITYYADKNMSIDGFKEIEITCSSGVDLEFTNDGDIIYFPSKLKAKVSGETLKIFDINAKPHTTYEIKLGTKFLRDVKLSCAGLKIKGEGNFKNLTIDSSGSFIRGQIKATNDISIDCLGLELKADLNGKTLKIGSSGADISSQMMCDKVEIDSAALNIRAKAKFKDFYISTTVLNGSIDILNGEQEKGVLNIEATGGVVKLDNLYNAPVTTKTSGYVKLVRE